MDVQFLKKLFSGFLSKSVKTEENISNGNKSNKKDKDPSQNSADSLGFEVNEKIGINQRGGCSGNQDRGIKTHYCCLNKDKNNVGNGEPDGSDRLW